MSRTTDKYIKIRKEADKAPENEIRIRADARIGRYISYAATLLLERKLDTVILKASGVATRSAVQIAEILRHRIFDLHQLTQLKTITVLDEYEPREEGLDRVSIERHLAVLEITLSMKADVLDTNQAGYQAPLPKDQVQEEDLKSLTERRRPFRDGDRARSGDDRREGGRGGRGYGGRGRGGRGLARGRGGRGFGGRGFDGRRDDDREDRREGGRGGRGGRGFGGRGRGYGGRGRGGYGGEDRGYGNQERGYSNQDRGYTKQERSYGNQDRGYGNQDRGYDNQERGYGGQERGTRRPRGEGRRERY